MPFVPQDELERLRSQAAELRVFDEMRPFLHLAVELRMELEAAIEGNLDLTPSEIGELAYQKVLQTGVAQARDEVVAVYEQTYRSELYERVREEVDETEGPEILEEVKTRLDTDPELARELHDSVRRELGARAMGVMRDQISIEQQDVINEEAHRQLELDRLDVELAIEGELDLYRDDINKLIAAGDTVDIFYIDTSAQKQKIRLKWVKDGHDQQGWVIDCDMSILHRRDGSNFPTVIDQFVEVGTLQSDLKNGNKIVAPNLLTVGMPLVLTQGTKKKQIDHCVPYTGSSYYSSQRNPVILIGTDFKTKNLDFFSGLSSK